ncbi:MAG: hypothetical protein AB2L09_07350 [Coriobacteriia bacterium]
MTKTIRTGVSIVLLAIGALAVTASLTARWADRTLLDTDTFVAAATPLVTDESMLDSASTRISAAITKKTDLEALADSSAVPQPLKPLVRSAADGFNAFVSTQIASAVHSDSFTKLALGSLRVWHGEFRSAVTTTSPVDMQSAEAVRITLDPYFTLLAEQTDDPVLAFAISILPQDVRSAQVAVLDLRPLAQASLILRALYRAAPYLPWVAAAALLGGVLVAPRRSFAIAGAGLGVAFVGGVVLVLLGLVLHGQTARLAEGVGASVAAADSVVSALTMPLVNALVWAVAAGAVVGAAGVGIAVWERSRRRRKTRHSY